MKTSMNSPAALSCAPSQYSFPYRTGNLGRLEIVYKRAVRSQRLFQLGNREARVDREECACGIHRLEHHFRSATAAHAIPEHFAEDQPVFGESQVSILMA